MCIGYKKKYDEIIIQNMHKLRFLVLLHNPIHDLTAVGSDQAVALAMLQIVVTPH